MTDIKYAREMNSGLSMEQRIEFRRFEKIGQSDKEDFPAVFNDFDESWVLCFTA